MKYDQVVRGECYTLNRDYGDTKKGNVVECFDRSSVRIYVSVIDVIEGRRGTQLEVEPESLEPISRSQMADILSTRLPELQAKVDGELQKVELLKSKITDLRKYKSDKDELVEKTKEIRRTLLPEGRERALMDMWSQRFREAGL